MSSPVKAARQQFDFRGRQVVLRLLRPFEKPATTAAAVSRLQPLVGANEAYGAPIFLLGAGWRTGSTLLQRMVSAVPGTFIWGEPYNDLSIVPRLAESVRCLDPEQGRFHSWIHEPGTALPAEDDWIATLSPPLNHLIEAYRALLDRLWRDPALERGAVNWGVKEVVWDLDCVLLLKLLYPRAKFVMLVRDPQSQWRSYRPETRRPWFYRYPDRPVGSPPAFGRMWNHLVQGFLSAEEFVDGAIVVRYEDLHEPHQLERISVHLGLDEVLHPVGKVGSSERHRFYTADVPSWEQAVIRRLTMSGREALGYA